MKEEQYKHNKIHFEWGDNEDDTEVAVIVVINSQVKKPEAKYLIEAYIFWDLRPDSVVTSLSALFIVLSLNLIKTTLVLKLSVGILSELINHNSHSIVLIHLSKINKSKI